MAYLRYRPGRNNAPCTFSVARVRVEVVDSVEGAISALVTWGVVRRMSVQ